MDSGEPPFTTFMAMLALIWLAGFVVLVLAATVR
jgi:hypothetical protein